MLEKDIVAAAGRLLEICIRKKLTIATAESCTGGLVAGMLTELPGVSAMLERGFITYSNRAKEEMLGVPADILAQHGAVSAQTACAMAQGALLHSPADLAVSVTGIAGPSGDESGKPIGLVHFAAASKSGLLIHSEQNFGNPGRSEIRKQAVLLAFAMLHELAEQVPANS